MGRLLKFFLIGVSVLGSIAWAREDGIHLKGRVAYSFSPNYFVIETDRYFYKLARADLSTSLQKNLELTLASSAVTEFTVPQKAIEFAWPTPAHEGKEGVAKKSYSVEKGKISFQDGNLLLQGQSLLSFSEPVYLIQVDQQIFQIKKAGLTSDQRARMESSGVGQSVALSIPSGGVERVWSFKEPASRHLASVSELSVLPDSVSVGRQALQIRGVVLYSFAEPLALLQSSGKVFQIRKEALSDEDRSKMDSLGSQVSVTVPRKALDFVWSMNSGPAREGRMPASKGLN